MKIHLGPTLEFYITNQCNLSCSRCNRFNDYDFQGHFYWEDHARDYITWAHRIDADLITVLGGEPTLNPGLENWISNIRTNWPNTPIMIQTNGLGQWHTKKQYYWDQYQVGFGVSAHSQNLRTKLQQNWDQHRLVGQQSVFAAYKFSEATVVQRNGKLTVHRSDPKISFDSCTIKHSHTLFQGKLYKCPMGAVLPIFREQQKVHLDPDQEELLKNYHWLASDCSDEDLELFVRSREQPIAQCALCPEKTDWQTIELKPRSNHHWI